MMTQEMNLLLSNMMMTRYIGTLRKTILTLLVLMTVGVGEMWGDGIVSGKYYRIYTGSTWYLWPAAMTTNNQNAKEYPDDNLWAVTYNGITAEGYTGNGVDYDDYDETYSIWQVTQVTNEENTYYQLYNIGTQRYLVWDKTGQEGRAVHLEKSSTISESDWNKTYFKYTSGKVLTPMGSTLSLNSYGGDKPYLVSVNGSNKPQLMTGNNNLGLIGLWGSGQWTFVKVENITPPTPEITIDLAGNVTITCSNASASIYYTTDGTDPTSSSTAYTATFSVVNGTTVKAIAINNGLSSEIASETYTVQTVATPAISIAENGTVTISCDTEGASIYYTTNGADPTSSSTSYSAPFVIEENVTVKAIAIREHMNNSAIASATNTVTTITSLSQITESGGRYKLGADIDAGGFTSIESFSGTLEGDFHTISNLSAPIFKTASGAKIKNVILDNVSIGSGDDNGDAGAIACSATGATRIYNCGVLSGSVSGSNYVGSIVGKLEGNTRVINCFSFATVNGGTWGGGIVGYNSTATTQDNVGTSGMVMNCMFYGEISGGSIAPVFGGENISNDNSSGKALNTYNYFRYMADYMQSGTNTITYNCALAAQELHLKRFEFYRNLLNSNRELAAWYATGSVDDADSKMAKWVLDRSVADYPILKKQGTYPSVINFDAENAIPLSERNQGGLLGTLSVRISGTGTGAPSGASLTKNSLTLNITDKDPDNYNFNYYKVQLPYYNEVGEGNYTENKVVTGWKVTVSGGTNSFNNSSLDASIDGNGVVTTPYNFADRKSTEKDNYNTSGRIFPQGGYFNVPEGVESISIEPYWGTAVYLSDPYYDEVYNSSYSKADVDLMGKRFVNDQSYSFKGSSQKVYTSLSNALSKLSTSGTPYDQAIVLVGNYHIYGDAAHFGTSKPCTVMSIDQNNDNEPDYSLIYQHGTPRTNCPPIRFDFLNWMPLGMAQKVTGTNPMPNIGLFLIKNWFEVTTTCITELNEIEYDHKEKSDAPLILLGGHVSQITSQNSDNNYGTEHTTYIHLGDNVYFDNFCNGVHSDKTTKTTHCPISVTGGEYENFYLSGIYRPDANYFSDNAECYINGGKFGEMAGAGHETINGDVYWRIDHADIENFYGGGINDKHPITGNIDVIINNSRVTQYCGGPKFGDMATDKTVTTSATGTTFGTYFGAGYGGTALNRVREEQNNSVAHGNDDNSLWGGWENDKYTRTYVNEKGISTSYETEYFFWAGGTGNKVARFYVNYASLSLANTNNVTSSLTNCTVETNFYGGGNLGAVTGDVVSTLTNTTVKGNAFGAGFSASVPSVAVYPTTGFVKVPSYNNKVGIFNEPTYPTAVAYTWSSKGSNKSPFTEDEEGNWIHTDVDLSSLGAVTGTCTLTINGTSTIGESYVADSNATGNVYGGGEESDVNRNAENGNTIVNIEGNATVNGSVFAAGKGKDDDADAAHVGGNATVTITDNAQVLKNVYGGGQMASVGDASEEKGVVTDANPFGYKTGTARVTINGAAQIGTEDNCTGEHGFGYVYGSGLGEAGKPGYAFVKNTIVTIGDDDIENNNPVVRGSVFGSGEDGHVRHDTQVNIKSGTVGTALTEAEHTEINGEGAVIYRGNVYGGGRGVDLYEHDEQQLLSTTAGLVYGNATVNITGGLIYHDVYGAGSLASVGTITDTNEDGTNDFLTDNFTAGTGVTTVNVSGGQIGVTGFNDGRVYGAGRGASGIRESQVAHMEFVNKAIVNISEDADIRGCVFGGGENGHVKGDTKVTISGGTIGTELTAEEASFQTDGTGTIIYRGNVYGGGRGVDHIADLGETLSYTAGRVYGNTEVEITGGTIRHAVYGGGSLASVGTYAKDEDENITAYTSGGTATVSIKGGLIGNAVNPGKNNGNVFGSCRGMVAATSEAQYSRMAFVNNTVINIYGTEGGSTGADIRGCVFGGGENGHVFADTQVNVMGGTIGEPFTESEMEINTTTGANASGYHLYRGNVYGGGRGVDKVGTGDNEHLSATAGRVYGHTYVTVSGGTIRHNVFGGGSLASVGTFTTDKNAEYSHATSTWTKGGDTHVTISGGTIGQSGTNNGFVFGSGRGMAATSADAHNYAQMAFVNNTNVTIGAGTVLGSVFGSGENGHVHNNTVVTINGGTIGSENCSKFAGNIYGGGRGVDGSAESTMSSTAGWVGGKATVKINKGTIYHDVYGGGSMGSVGVSTEDNTGEVTVLVNGGTVGVAAEAAKGYGNVYGGGRGMAGSIYANLAFVKRTFVTIKNDSTDGVRVAHVLGNVFGGGNAGHVRRGTTVTLASGTIDGNMYGGGAGSIESETAGLVHHNVRVYMNGGTVGKNVYGGGAIANTNIHDKDNATEAENCPSSPKEECFTKVELNGGLIKGDAYGGGEGEFWEPTEENKSTYMTDTSKPLYNQQYWNATAKAEYAKHAAIVYGDVTLTLNGTAFATTTEKDSKGNDVPNSGRIFGCNNINGTPKGSVKVHVKRTIPVEDDGTSRARAKGNYEVEAVYGGGNLAGYQPYSTLLSANAMPDTVLIEGCDETSIKYVYGGGSAADVPATNVVITGAYEIYQAFGGGNGMDMVKPDGTNWRDNYGADVGRYWYTTEMGTGNTTITIEGGTIHQVFGGSNTLGTIYGQTALNVGQTGDCALCVDDIFNGGNKADTNGGTVVLGCTDYMKRLYAGANAANVNGNVELTITSGRFDQVFAGNNDSGVIRGSIKINIEETGCNPIIIGELYGGGNNAAYSIYGYKEVDGKLVPRSSMDDGTVVMNTGATAPTSPYDSPELNIMSFTSIGKVFGGGRGKDAVVYGNPTVNINEVVGVHASSTTLRTGETIASYLGAGKTISVLNRDAEGNITEDSETIDMPTHASGKIGGIGYVYGGGNAADVIGNTAVNICTVKSVTYKSGDKASHDVEGADIRNDVYGGGKGSADTYKCEKAMVGKDGDGIENPEGGTSVTIGNGTVGGNVYGGGEVGRVEKNTVVTIGLENDNTSAPVIRGSVFGAGKGVKTHGYAALVRGNPTVYIQGNAKIGQSVYGGGEIASVARYKVAETEEEAAAHGVAKDMPYALANETSGNCIVYVRDNAEIGPDGMKMYHEGVAAGEDAPDDMGHVFGAGKGILPQVYDYTADNDDHKPKRMIDDNGTSKWEWFANEEKYIQFIQTLALASKTQVYIQENALVKGSVYGGSENGLVQYDTDVNIEGGQIGVGKNTTLRYTDDVWADNYVLPADTDLECASWDYGRDEDSDDVKEYAPYDPNANATGDVSKYSSGKSTEGGRRIASDGHTFYGNVFGGGSGSIPYFDTAAGISKYLNTAGCVRGNTKVTISGGHILTNVYGGCEATNVLGDAKIVMTGGTLGVPRTLTQIVNHPVTCYLFGAGKGDQRIFFNKDTNVQNVDIDINGGRIYGSVFGGGEDGHVMRNVNLTIEEKDGKTIKIGTTGTSYVDGNVFGGGRGFGGDALTAGNVAGTVNLTIKSGTMLGSIYGGGRLASVGYGLYLVSEEGYGVMRPDNQDDAGNTVADFKRGYININISGGTIGNDEEYIYNPTVEQKAVIPQTTFFTYGGHEHLSHTKGGNVFAGCMGRMTKLDGTTNELWWRLARAKKTKVTISGNARIKSNVYGGAEFGAVTEDTEVIIKGGTIGTEIKNGETTMYTYGSVYGSGYGSDGNVSTTVTEDGVEVTKKAIALAGVVYGNTSVTVEDTPADGDNAAVSPLIYHNVYGGGELASVGTLTYTENVATSCAENTGKATVTITGGTIGLSGHEDGLVFGSGRGDIHEPGFYDQEAWVDNTTVTIGTADSETGPDIRGSVYGSGENGHTLKDTHVNIHSGVIGIDNPEDVDGGARYIYRGNVYGGGCGTDTYTDGGKTYYNRLSGVVRGNTHVTMDGGKVVRCVYGGGAMGSVGAYTYDANNKPATCTGGGTCTVSITGGEVGPDGMKMLYDADGSGNRPRPYDAGHVFAAGRGEVHNPADYPNLEKVVYVNNTDLTIGGTAFIKGSVYGGAESGHVLGDTYVKITGNCQIGQGEGKTEKYTAEQWTSADAADFTECAHWPYTAGVYTVYDPFVTSVTTDDSGNQTGGTYADGSDANGGVTVPQNGQTFYGCVFAGGCGYYPYAAGRWLDSAGLVEGNAKLEMTGGHVLTNVYGGNEMTDVLGNSTLVITGGTVGVPRSREDMIAHPVTCYVFGGGRGDQRTWFNTKTNIHQNSTLTVTGTARIFGSVYGGGEDGHVFGDTQTTLGNTTVTVADTEQTFDAATVTVGTLGTSGVDGNVFGSGRGFTVTAYTAGSIGGNATLNINSGTSILGSVYGGGRMASVGSYFVDPSDTHYGTLRPDGDDPDTPDVTETGNHGHTTINISGGTIGAADEGVLRTSSYSIGDVFGGCKGVPDAGEHAKKFGIAKYTTINMTAGTVYGSIYGGGESGNVLKDTNITITEPDSEKKTIVGGNVYGGGKSAAVGGDTKVSVGQ